MNQPSGEHKSKHIDTGCCLVCRYEFATDLAREICSKLDVDSKHVLPVPGYGAVIIDTPSCGTLISAPVKPFVFERQRIESAVFISGGPIKQTAREILTRILPPITLSNAPWTIHAFAAESSDESSNGSRAAASLADVFLEMCKDRFSRVYRRYVPVEKNIDDKTESQLPNETAWVLQICAAGDGIWAGATPLSRLSDTRTGGIHRMAFDENAPSRSYLKIEEAFDRMQFRPVKGDSVIDLGAAPGGWTYAFLKRGCRVWSVDNGPMKIASVAPGTLTHIRHDGIGFTPPPSLRPVDWMVSDMLTDSGTNMGMLRKWLDNRWMRRFVVNIKLPQDHPLQAIATLERFLSRYRHFNLSIRQLYHDRREVTIMGTLE
jgi:hypothetical protein